MAKLKSLITCAVRQLRRAGVDFSEHHYDYLTRDGAPHAASELGLDLHHTVKTLVFADDKKQPLLVLMQGDYEISAKSIARQLGLKTLALYTPEVAHKHTGYQIGGISPFGTRRRMPICVEATALKLNRIYVNGGKRGFLMGISPRSLRDILQATPVSAAIDYPKGDIPCWTN